MFGNKIICPDYKYGFCSKGASCPYLHQNAFSEKREKNNNYCFFSKDIFSSYDDLSKKKKKKKNFFEDFEDIPLKINKYYSASDTQKMSELNDEFSNFDLFNEIKDENNQKINYCIKIF